MGSRGFAQRLKRLESRFVPPDRPQREIVIQTVGTDQFRRPEGSRAMKAIARRLLSLETDSALP